MKGRVISHRRQNTLQTRGHFHINNLIVQFINRSIVEKVLNFVSSSRGLL